MAISLGTVIGVVTNVILPNILQNTYPSRFAFIAIIIWTGLLTYAVIQHRFLDIRLAIARTVAYLLVLFTLVVTYALAVFGVIELFFGQTQQVSMAQSIVYIVSAVFLAFTYAPLKLFFDRITDTIFFQHDYDVQTTLNKLGDVAVDEIDLRRVSVRSMDILSTALKPQYVSAFILSAAREFSPYRFHIGKAPQHLPRDVEEDLFSSIGKVQDEMIVVDQLDETRATCKKP